jgi:hypothetical protein
LDLPVDLQHPRAIEDLSVQKLHESILGQHPELLGGQILPAGGKYNPKCVPAAFGKPQQSMN